MNDSRVYGLLCSCHPEAGIRYVGSTRRSLESRLKDHTKPGWVASAKYPVTRWIGKHGPGNIRIELLEQCDSENLDEREIYWISYYRSVSNDLLNLAPGGRNSPVRKHVSEDARSRISNALKEYYSENPNPFQGRKHSEESRAKMSASATGRRLSEETKKKVSEASRGRKASPETLKKMSEANRGEKNPMYGSEGYWKGKKRDPETVRKMSIAQQGEKARSARLNETQVMEILKSRGSCKAEEVAPSYGVSASAIRDIWARRTWKHVELNKDD